MTQKPKLEPGQRIKFLGPCVERSGLYPSRDQAFFNWDGGSWATVEKLGEFEGSLHIVGKSFKGVIHRRQVTHVLRPKQQPEKERERKTWHVGSFSQTEDGGTTGTLFPNGHVRPPCFGTDLVTIESGQMVLGREELEKAIDQIPLSMSSCERYKQITEPLCKRFGIGKDKA